MHSSNDHFIERLTFISHVYIRLNMHKRMMYNRYKLNKLTRAPTKTTSPSSPRVFLTSDFPVKLDFRTRCRALSLNHLSITRMNLFILKNLVVVKLPNNDKTARNGASSVPASTTSVSRFFFAHFPESDAIKQRLRAQQPTRNENNHQKFFNKCIIKKYILQY